MMADDEHYFMIIKRWKDYFSRLTLTMLTFVHNSQRNHDLPRNSWRVLKYRYQSSEQDTRGEKGSLRTGKGKEHKDGIILVLCQARRPFVFRIIYTYTLSQDGEWPGEGATNTRLSVDSAWNPICHMPFTQTEFICLDEMQATV